MKYLLLTLLLFVPALAPTPAACSYCYTGKCYSGSICGRGCMCLKRGLDVHGYCFSVD